MLMPLLKGFSRFVQDRVSVPKKSAPSFFVGSSKNRSRVCAILLCSTWAFQ